MIALDKGLCKQSDLDPSLCRESIVLPDKILLFNKKRLKIGLVAVQPPIFNSRHPNHKAEKHTKPAREKQGALCIAIHLTTKTTT